MTATPDPQSADIRPAFHADLIRKYSRPGPRYTSYPTAPHFSGEIDKQHLLSAFGGPEASTKPLSLYLHLPFCESNCWFCGCTKVITNNRSSADRYLDYLEKEVKLLRKHLAPGRQVNQLHLGGGTPTFFSAVQLLRLGGLLHDAFDFSPDSENGVEIDPRRLSRDQIEALRAIGFNRASLGVQDNNPEVQRAIHRIQPRELTEQAIHWLRETGFQSINIDLIYGLPMQTVDSFTRTVEETIALQPDRLALFGYAHVPWIKPAQKIFEKRNNLPDDASRMAILEHSSNQLLDAGYRYIGMDHFARADDELTVAQREHKLQRNFQGYSTCGGSDICALGMSAISQTATTYHQNSKELQDYYASLDTGELPIVKGYELSPDDRIRRSTIMRLMCDLHLSFEAMSQDLNIDFADYFREAIDSLRPMAEDGLVTVTDEHIDVTPSGRFLLRNIAMNFDAYLQQSQARYSKTV